MPSSFISRVTKPVGAQLSLPVPQHKGRKTAAPPMSTPRRSRRVAKLPPETVPRAAVTVCRQLGISRKQEQISDEALKRYTEVFNTPLSEVHLAALAALFVWEVPREAQVYVSDLVHTE